MYQKVEINEKEIENENKVESKIKFNWKALFSNKKNIALYIISILISRVGFASGINPFGMAMYGAIGNMKVPLVVPFILISATTLIFFGPGAMLKFLLAALLYTGIKAFIKGDDGYVNSTIKMMIATLLTEIVSILITNSITYDYVIALYTTIMTAIFYMVFSEGIRSTYNIKKEKISSRESLIAMGVTIAIATCGIGNLNIFSISIRGIISILIVMLLGWKKGSGVGAAGGIMIALAIGVTGTGNILMLATYGLCGFFAGMLARFGKLGAAVGFLIGNVILAIYTNASSEMVISLKEIIVASVFLFIMPKRISEDLDEVLDYDQSLDTYVKGFFKNNTVYRLNAMSDVINEMADNADNTMTTEITDEIGSFIKTLNDNTCKRCEHFDKCWKQNYHSMYETVFNSIETLQNKNEIEEKDVIENTICNNKSLLIDGLNFCYQIYKVNQNWQTKMQEKIKQMSKQMKNVSKAITEITTDIEENADKPRMLKAQDRYTLEIGTSEMKKNKSDKSGDSYIIARLDDGKYIIAISDGMGSGIDAQKKSSKVISMVEKLLNTGFNKEAAIEIVNSMMLLDENEDVFATLDLLILDPYDGNTEFIKISACPTYIKNNSDVTIINKVALPIGVLTDVDFDLYDKKIKEDDYIIMMTDGIMESNSNYENKTMWVHDLVKAINIENPQRLADIILQEAVDNNYGIADDDMTVIVAKVNKK